MATVNKFKCPECGARYKTAALVAMHRQKVHGVAGKSQSSIVKQLLANPEPTATPVENQCGTCGFQAKTKAGLSLHVNTYHVVKELPPAVPVGFSCEQCDFVGSTKIGLSNHKNRKHGVVSMTADSVYQREWKEKRRQKLEEPTQGIVVATRPGKLGRRAQEEGHASANGHAIADSTLALALGRFQGLCQSMAVEFDLPPRMFAARLAELIYHSQVR